MRERALVLTLLLACAATADARPGDEVDRAFQDALATYNRSKAAAIPKLERLLVDRWPELTTKGRRALTRYLDHMEALIRATRQP